MTILWIIKADENSLILQVATDVPKHSVRRLFKYLFKYLYSMIAMKAHVNIVLALIHDIREIN